jgi:hypothetical protein
LDEDLGKTKSDSNEQAQLQHQRMQSFVTRILNVLFYMKNGTTRRKFDCGNHQGTVIVRHEPAQTSKFQWTNEVNHYGMVIREQETRQLV